MYIFACALLKSPLSRRACASDLSYPYPIRLRITAWWQIGGRNRARSALSLNTCKIATM